MAWEYQMDGAPRTAVVVIGGPIIEADPERKRKLEEQHCGQRTQGLRITADAVMATVRVAEGSVNCERAGADEQEFWLFARDR